MREIIHLQLGQCGNTIGCKFWEVITNEHGINSDGNWQGESELQKQRLNIYFNETDHNTYVPRAILVDLDPSGTSSVISSQLGGLFRPDNIISGKAAAGNNWAKGFYYEGVEVMDQILEIIRREVEYCDLIQGFQITHSLGGGTGSGLTSKLLANIRDEYTNRIIATYSVFPSSKTSDTVVEPYNTTLAFQYLTNFVDNASLIDNEALHDICSYTLQILDPSYDDMNYLISLCMAGTTACLRFPGQLNADLRKLHINMVPFPKLHFFVPGFAPLMSKLVEPYRKVMIRDLVYQMFNPKLSFVRCNPSKGRFLTVAAVFRGKISTKEVEEKMWNIQNKKKNYFVDWIPNCIKTAICDIVPPGFKMTVTTMSNTTAIQEPLKRIVNECSAMFERKAYIHWYTSEGMEESELEDAQNSLYELISEYQQQETGNNRTILENIDEKEHDSNINDNNRNKIEE
ncbi:tubulin beta chain-like [Chelonus insularis]|uniref:tubulin beta chain-like n=1 Tax=Chelonus insularis TaxID=460826 RepID=UPI00158E3831|nr:tubulin beta chain-like [Chelonus insularis]